MKQQKKQRKQSWQYLDLAYKVQFPRNTYAPRIMLWFLAKSANDSGKSWYGYRAMQAHTGLSNAGISSGIRYLRDKLFVLTWEHGSGGINKQATNAYQLDLQAMRRLVASQSVFDLETGKLCCYLGDSHLDPAESTDNKVAAAGAPVATAAVIVDPSVATAGAPLGTAQQSKTLKTQQPSITSKATPSKSNSRENDTNGCEVVVPPVTVGTTVLVNRTRPRDSGDMDGQNGQLQHAARAANQLRPRESVNVTPWSGRQDSENAGARPPLPPIPSLNSTPRRPFKWSDPVPGLTFRNHRDAHGYYYPDGRRANLDFHELVALAGGHT
jgi:hypothetical protein